MESGDPAMAEEAFREIEAQLTATGSPRDRANLIFGRAGLYGALRKFDDARTQLSIALQESPDDPFTQMQFDLSHGLLFDQECRPREAYERLTAALSKHAKTLRNPELRDLYEDAQQRRGFDLVRIERFQEAVPILEEVLSFDLEPEIRGCALADLGICHLKLQEYERARDFLVEASSTSAGRRWDGQVHYYLGVAYSHLRLLRDAKREFQICEQHSPEYGVQGFPLNNVYAWLSQVCKSLGEQAESEHYARLSSPS
jgi:tetratricopeptide (TPR) repeat protein